MRRFVGLICQSQVGDIVRFRSCTADRASLLAYAGPVALDRKLVLKAPGELLVPRLQLKTADAQQAFAI